MPTDPTDGPDTSELEERAERDDGDERGGAVVHNDDADLLAKLDKFDEDHAEAERAKKKAKQERAAAKGKEKPKAKDDDDDADEKDDDREEKKPPAKPKKDDDGDDEDDDDDEPDAGDDDTSEPAPKKKDEEEREIPSKALEAIVRERARAHADVEKARGEVIRRERDVQQKEAEIQAKWGPVAENQRKLDILGSKVKVSPRAGIQLLKNLGATQWEEIANFAISQTDNPKITPEFKRQYTLDDGGALTEVEELRRKQLELEQKLERSEREKKEEAALAQAEKRELAHVEDLVKHAGDKHPFVAAGMKNNPKHVKAALRALTQELYVAGGNIVPTHDQVLTEFERRRREEAAAYGLPLPTKKKPIAGENETAKETLASPSRARAALDDDEDDDEDEDARQARIRSQLDEMDEEDRLKKKARRK